MKPDDLDRVLAGEPDIVPSSGFVAAVMDAVSADATAPPLPFPWKRAWPFAAGFAALFVWLSFLQFESQAAAAGPDLYGWFKTFVPMATGVGRSAEDRDIERHFVGEVDAHARRGVPHRKRIADASARFERADPLLEPGAELAAAEPVTDFDRAQPAVSVVRRVDAIVDRQLDACVGDRNRHALKKA